MPVLVPLLVGAAAADYLLDLGWLRAAKDLITYHHCGTPVDAVHPFAGCCCCNPGGGSCCDQGGPDEQPEEPKGGAGIKP